MMYVSNLKKDYETLGLPKRFVDLLPETCPTCGAVMAMSETLTGLHCENSRCPDKLVMRIKAICNDLGILGFGESTIEKFIDYYEITNPLNMFALQKGMPLSDEVSDKVSDNITEQIVNKRNFLLWEYVRVANIPHVQTSAMQIFQGYDDLEEAFKDIESGGVRFIQDKLGITNDGELSIRAMKIYKSLMEYKEDLLESIVDVNIISLNGVNNTFEGKVHVNFLSSVTKNIDYLVWAGADGSPARYTSKVKTVENWNAKGSNIPIVTAQQFIDIMQGL